MKKCFICKDRLELRKIENEYVCLLCQDKLLKKLTEVSIRQPTNYVSGMYICAIKNMKEHFYLWLENKNNLLDVESLKDFISVEGFQ